MNEKSTKYEAGGNAPLQGACSTPVVPGVNGHVVLTELVHDNSKEIYMEMVVNAANAMIISGALDTGQFDEEEIIDRAINFTDLMITKVESSRRKK
jgi:hypothetical protein